MFSWWSAVSDAGRISRLHELDGRIVSICCLLDLKSCVKNDSFALILGHLVFFFSSFPFLNYVLFTLMCVSFGSSLYGVLRCKISTASFGDVFAGPDEWKSFHCKHEVVRKHPSILIPPFLFSFIFPFFSPFLYLSSSSCFLLSSLSFCVWVNSWFVISQSLESGQGFREG